MADQETDPGKQKLWFIRQNGKIKGPFPSGSIRRFMLIGRVLPQDEVSHNRKGWQPASSVPEVVPPEIRKAITEGNLEGLIPARLREDERRGRERRQGSDDAEYKQRRKGERRQAETEIESKHRQAKLELSDVSQRKRRPVIGVVVSVLLVSLVIGYGLYLGAPEAIPDPECNAAPAPGVNWRNCRLDGLKAESAELNGAMLNNAVLRGARLSGSRINRADLQYIDLSVADLSYVELKSSRMKGANLINSDLSYADLSGADLRFSNLTNANLGGANLAQTQFGNAIWIDGRICLPGSVGRCSRADTDELSD